MWYHSRNAGQRVCQSLVTLTDLINPRISRSLPPIQSLTSRSVWNDAKTDDSLSFYDSTVEDYAKQPIEKLTLKHLLEAGKDAWFDPSKTLEHAHFTLDQLPKRLARRLMDLQLLPHIVVTNPFINQVYRAYYHAFNTLRATDPPRDMKENEMFVQLLRRLVDEHAPMLDALAAGLRECRRKPIVGEQLKLDAFLENMLRSRISRRVLAEQHININHARPNYIGVICTNLDLADSVDFAAGKTRQVCTETFGMAPDILISGDSTTTISYIPAHIDYMLYELLKNAARAVVERHHRLKNSTYNHSLSSSALLATHHPAPLPPILVRLCGGGEGDVAVRVSDEGGGIPSEDVDKVWEFGWTTIDNHHNHQQQRQSSIHPTNDSNSLNDILVPGSEGLGADNQPRSFSLSSSTPSHSSSASINPAWAGVADLGGAAGAAAAGGGVGQVGRFRMAGLGFGLPLSRLYARYFGGDLQLVTIPGYGTDVFLSLKRLEGSWGEGNMELGTPVMGIGAQLGGPLPL